MTMQEDFDKISPYLYENGKEIGEKARNGDKEALEIMKYYKMFYDCHEPMSLIFLEEAVNKYKLKQIELK